MILSGTGSPDETFQVFWVFATITGIIILLLIALLLRTRRKDRRGDND